MASMMGQTYSQSMNGIVTLTDGMGTIIENNSIITGDISANIVSSTNITAIYANVLIEQGQRPPIYGNVITLQGQIPPIYGNVSTLQTQLPPIYGNVISSQNQINSVYGNVISSQTQITSVYGNVISLQTQRNAIYANVSTLQTQLPPIYGNVISSQTQIKGVYGNVSTLQQKTTGITYTDTQPTTIITGNTSINGNIYLNNNPLYLGVEDDYYHSLAYHGVSLGPSLQGYGGGRLGTIFKDDVLKWYNDNSVYIDGLLTVSGNEEVFGDILIRRQLDASNSAISQFSATGESLAIGDNLAVGNNIVNSGSIFTGMEINCSTLRTTNLVVNYKTIRSDTQAQIDLINAILLRNNIF